MKHLQVPPHPIPLPQGEREGEGRHLAVVAEKDAHSYQ